MTGVRKPVYGHPTPARRVGGTRYTRCTPHRAEGTHRHAPHLSRVAGTTCRREGAVSHYPNSWSRCAKGFQGAMSLQASRAQLCRPHRERASPAQQRVRRQSPCTHANRSPECVPAPPTPRTAAPSPRSRYQPCRRHHKRASPAQQRARSQSPCTHTNRSPEQCSPPPHAAHSRAEPEEPRRAEQAPQVRTAPFTRRS